MASSKLLKEVACSAIDAAGHDLDVLSKDIWEHPELMFEEHHAHKTLTDFLQNKGFEVEKNYILDTAFRATWGKEGPHVSVLCEYDALPNIGHACGHNLIAEVGAGAGIGIRAAIEEARKAGQEIGKVTVLGTPGEEGGGGKVDLLNAGVFKVFDASMMCHPWAFTVPHCDMFLVRYRVTVVYHGKASHAAGFPWDGVNALDAAVMAYTSISNLRQQMKPTWRIHGIITNGGSKPNIIPELTELEYSIRAPTMQEVEVLKAKAVKCFEAAASATGCTVEIKWNPKSYANVITNTFLAGLFEENARSLGVEFLPDSEKPSGSGSTDMGNVSQVVPSIHPMFYIGSKAVNHTREFTTASGDPKAQSYTIRQAKALAMTAIDVMCNPENLKKVKQTFIEQTSQ